MKREAGHHIPQRILGESYKAYIPAPLPPTPPLELAPLSKKMEEATQALTELNAMTKSIPNISLFIYMYVRKEALLSSQIEGTQSSFCDLILFENDQRPRVALEDVEEVSNYVKAIQYGLSRLKEGFPLCLRLLKEIHGLLLSGGRGMTKCPGEIRTAQNWIGGTRPGNALFVPPPADHLMECLGNFETFLNDKSLPTLIKAALAHLQFETIHPFLDGNGRLGRLLITLLLCEGGLLEHPTLYLSLYLKRHYTVYFSLLQEVRNHGTWETWLEFFLDGVTASSKKAIQTAERINRVLEADLEKIQTLGRARFSCIEVFEHLKQLPQVTVPGLSDALSMSAPTARTAINHLISLGILKESSGKKRDRTYVYGTYLSILEEGAEPLIETP